MQSVWIVVSLVLAGSLALPRAWLHSIGIVGCSLLLWHAIELGDPAFVIVQFACIVFHAAGLMLWTLGRKLSLRRMMVRGARELREYREHREQHECWRNN